MTLLRKFKCELSLKGSSLLWLQFLPLVLSLVPVGGLYFNSATQGAEEQGSCAQRGVFILNLHIGKGSL